MRLAASTVSLCLLFCAGCGYVGPVLPPSPEIPPTITDVAAAERGDDLIITFNTPARTMDGVAIDKFSHIDLRIGPENQPPESAKSYDVEVPSPSDKEDPQPKPIEFKLKVAEWSGQRIAVAVRTAVKKKGHFSPWSNKAVLDVVPPLQTPVIKAESSANGIVLTWTPVAGVQYRIQRQGPSDKQPFELATAGDGTYVDSSSQYETEYHYIVTAKKGAAESLPSEPITYTSKDIFAPAIPTGITILAGPDAINLAWQRDVEPDLQGYYIYRSTNNGPFERQGGLVTLPTYVDQKIEHGKTYAYKISAIDKNNNESGQSAAVESTF